MLVLLEKKKSGPHYGGTCSYRYDDRIMGARNIYGPGILWDNVQHVTYSLID